ncbi:MAG: hypothetical protein C5B54_11090 [Acidobacteria bacterium]|nr:MAG: hypothetical protein C5B54_11090 [Acidobacteriota bacterium]
MTTKFFFIFSVMMLMLSLSIFAEDTSKNNQLVPVQSKFVCMVNDKAFDKEQIPVEVEGKTYYGCCQMCKDKLAQDSQIRTATDPVSGKKVDKATAVIAKQADGSVVYFENEENMKKYSPQSHEEHKDQ